MYSEKLQKIRKSLRLTQSEIAGETGTSYRAYSSYERGERNPSLEFLAQIEKLYRVNLNWLIADDGEMFTSSAASEFVLKSELHTDIIRILKHEGVIK